MLIQFKYANVLRIAGGDNEGEQKGVHSNAIEHLALFSLQLRI